MIHELKIQEAFYEAVLSGDKTFEIRKNDRGFQKGDTLILIKVDELGIKSLSDIIKCKVSYVLSGWGIQEGHVVLGLTNVREICNEN